MSDISHLLAARELATFRLGPQRVDVREWQVFASDGRAVGVVDRLYVEIASGFVRYVSIRLTQHAEHDERPTRPGCVLVPIGLVRRYDEQRALSLDALTSDVIAAAPRLPSRPPNRADEDATLAAFGMATSRDLPGGDLYSGIGFDESRLAS